MLRLLPATRRSIETHAVETYPQECCGFLIGAAGPVRLAHRIHRLTNTCPPSPHPRYEADPREWLWVERSLAHAEEIIGIYHSHPDCPPLPSKADCADASAGLSYVIVSVYRGRILGMRSWQLSVERAVFDEEELEVAA